MKTIITIFCLCFSVLAFSQTTVTGNVVDQNSVPIVGTNVIVVGTSIGTATDFDGKFTLTVEQAPPFSVEFSSIGYQSFTQEITENNQTFSITLNEGDELDEIVVSASRTPESVRESPVTIERLDARDIKNSSSPNFYASLENLKGVDVNRGSLTFNSVNTRGFATFANTRFVQLVDGMDNSSPALNFVMGNFLGMNELDVNSIELLPGASSALYGANAFNGILFMTSKSPFDHEGISTYIKTGVTSQAAAGDNNFYDFGVRAAHKFSDKFAAKASFSYLRGTEWFATDTNQYTLRTPGLPDEVTAYDNQPAFDGLNIYGDEVSLGALGTDLNGVAQSLEAQGLIPAGSSSLIPADNVSRTGYREQDLTDYTAATGKADFSLNYRPTGGDLEIIWNSKVGFGRTIYQGANRYQLDNFIMQQHKLEIKSKDFFVRAYTTNENAGNSYDMRFTGINMSKIGAQEWFGTYTGAYLQAVLGGSTSEQAHAAARIFADDNITLQPGTPEFIAAYESVISEPDVSRGSKFIDKSKSHVAEGNYNFKSLLNDYMDLQVGGSFKQFSLNSEGTIFTDYDGPITYSEYAAYTQASKKFLDEDRMKVTASIRYDKNEFFDGRFSPRVSLTYSAGERKQHNFRGSFQTGFRNPDTQSLFIGFNVGRALLVGSAPDNLDRTLPGTSLTGRDAYFDSYTLESVRAFAATGDPSSLVSVQTALVEQEKVQAFDLGYRGKIGKINIDANVYYNIYEGFISNRLVVTPTNGSTSDATGVADIVNGDTQVFQLYTNSLADVTSYGAVIGVSTKFAKNYRVGLNYTYAEFDFDQASDPGFQAGFNTPNHQVKLSIGNPELFKSFGFNVDGRYKGEYLWQSSLANAVMPEIFVLDAQINYSIPSLRSMIKVGGTNLTGNEFQSAVGTGNIGSQYYISWTFNN
ncbi:MAG: TonB-dependent receptor [Flavobacteriaceae bacterium]|nr:TonB-dependent receptor [Flavobacteriaceae bacterium]